MRAIALTRSWPATVCRSRSPSKWRRKGAPLETLKNHHVASRAVAVRGNPSINDHSPTNSPTPNTDTRISFCGWLTGTVISRAPSSIRNIESPWFSFRKRICPSFSVRGFQSLSKTSPSASVKRSKIGILIRSSQVVVPFHQTAGTPEIIQKSYERRKPRVMRGFLYACSATLATSSSSSCRPSSNSEARCKSAQTSACRQRSCRC